VVTDGGPRRRHVGWRLGVPSPEAVSTRTGADRGIRGWDCGSESALVAWDLPDEAAESTSDPGPETGSTVDRA